MSDDAFIDWIAALEQRHLADFRVQEVTRALRALSSVYVERREALKRGGALDSAGKRAAFALFYGPVHFLVTRAVARSLSVPAHGVERVLDLGCGTGAAGTAVALEAEPRPSILGVDVNRWALDEARWTWRHFGLRGEARVGDAARPPGAGRGTVVIAAYTVNELESGAREKLRPLLEAAGRDGAQVLVVEPIAIRPLPWWDEWRASFERLGGRADEWRIPLALPPRLRLLDKAAGLRHDQVKARSLYLPGSAS